MKRSGPPKRVTPLHRSGPLKRVALTAVVKPQRRRDTGPTRTVRCLVHLRSGDRCEWPGCPNRRADVHHRLGRGIGGRHGDMQQTINQPAWLLDACGRHHRYVTSAVGAALVEAKASGWVLLEGQDARLVPVLTRHAPVSVLLDNRGGWTILSR